jgi:5S rRNA maturation endonuclease (ribonuclease M5)
MTPVELVLERLERVKRSGTGWTARCPAHEDRNPSLSIAEGEDGRVLVKCHAGCETEAVLSELGLELRDLFPEKPSENGSRRIIANYPYVDEQGQLLFEAVRFEPKDFRQRRPDGQGGWIWNLQGVRRVLYRLPDAAAAAGTVYVVEGEKDVHALKALGLVATTSPMGAGKWRDEYAESLRGAGRVVVLSDDDEEGRAHAEQVARSLAGVVSDVRVVELWPRGETKADVSDWIAVAADDEERAQARNLLEEIAERTPQWQEAEESGQPFALPLDEFLATKSETPPALIGDNEENLLPATGLLLLFAKGGRGKTTLTAEAALHLASGVDWLGFKVERPLRVLFIENEGPQEPFRAKLELKRKLWEHEIRETIFVHTLNWGAFSLEDTGQLERLRAFIDAEGIDLVIGDPLDTLGIRGVGSPEDTRNFLLLMAHAGLFRTVAFWLLHHPRKEEAADELDQAAGAWGGKPDTVLKLERLEGERARLSFPKVRWSRRGTRRAYILAFDPDTESFTVAHEEEDEERDYFAEIAELLSDGTWRTVKEIAAPKDATDPGIGANDRTIAEVLEANPDTFESRTGKANRELGRHPSAMLWKVRQTFQRTRRSSTKHG